MNQEINLIGQTTMPEYISHLYDVYQQEMETKTLSHKKYIDKIYDLMESDPADMDSSEFICRYVLAIKKGNLSTDFKSVDRLFFNQIKENPRKLIDPFNDVFLDDFRDRLVDRFQQDPHAFMAQFYKTTERTKSMWSNFKLWLSSLPEFKPFDQFNFEPMTLTTNPNDHKLNKLVEERFGVSLTERGIDAVAVSKTGKVFLIEAKYIGQTGSHQNQQLQIALDLAKAHQGKFYGLAVIDGDPVIFPENYKKLARQWTDVDGRVTGSHRLINFLSNH